MQVYTFPSKAIRLEAEHEVCEKGKNKIFNIQNLHLLVPAVGFLWVYGNLENKRWKCMAKYVSTPLSWDWNLFFG